MSKGDDVGENLRPCQGSIHIALEKNTNDGGNDVTHGVDYVSIAGEVESRRGTPNTQG